MIYLVEDDESIRELLVYTLNGQGLVAEGFAYPSDFWHAMEKKIPDLVLLDIMLPEEDGLEILQKLRKKKETKNIPIAMLTAKGRNSPKMMKNMFWENYMFQRSVIW